MDHPVFLIYKRDYLHELTGYSKGYLSRVATGHTPLSRPFIERVCFQLKRREEDLFIPQVDEANEQ